MVKEVTEVKNWGQDFVSECFNFAIHFLRGFGSHIGGGHGG